LIIVQQKPLDQILEMTKAFKSILIVGCDGCASVVQVGGEKQAKILEKLLEMSRKIKSMGEQKTKSISMLRQCDRQIAFSSLRPLVDEYDAILSLGCGVGVQTIAEVYSDKVVLPACNTMFLGMHDKEKDEFHEMCRACGDCVLHETAGICPITRCAKSLLNGPCGGQADGKCEVGGWKNDCAWILIYNRLKEHGKLDLFLKFRTPKDYRISEHPRKIVPSSGEKAKEEVQG